MSLAPPSLKANLIVAVDRTLGMGYQKGLPWHLSGDLKHFARLTKGSSGMTRNQVIMGRKTYESLPAFARPLPGRINTVVSRSWNHAPHTGVGIAHSLTQALQQPLSPEGERWIIGGAELYQEALTNNLVELDEIHLTYLDQEHPVDTYFPAHFLDSTALLNTFRVVEQSAHREDDQSYHFLTLKTAHHGLPLSQVIPGMREGEFGYLHLLHQLVQQGGRGEWTDSRSGKTTSLFSAPLRFDLTRGFPLLTTKKMFWKGIAEELLFFLQGDTNAQHLAEKGVHIWRGNTTPEFLEARGLPYQEGDMGPMYGWQWRHFGAEYRGCDADYRKQGFDQLRDLIRRLIQDPQDRRLLMTSLNPADVPQSVLAPCHSLPLQFYVDEKNRLHCNMYQRSADIFLGVPFNIASTALLTHLLARVTNRSVGTMTLNFGDLHLYYEHLPMAHEQLRRPVLSMSQLEITRDPPSIPKDHSEDSISGYLDEALHYLETLTRQELLIRDYVSGSSIKALMKA